MNKENGRRAVEDLLKLSTKDLTDIFFSLPGEEASPAWERVDEITEPYWTSLVSWVEDCLPDVISGKNDGFQLRASLKQEMDALVEDAVAGKERLIYSSLYMQGKLMSAEAMYWNRNVATGFGDLSENKTNRTYALEEGARLYMSSCIYAGFKPQMLVETVDNHLNACGLPTETRFTGIQASIGRAKAKWN